MTLGGVLTVVLAHARPLDEAMAVMRRHPHVLCDSAFVPSENIASLVQAGFGGRMLFGTDFPITHYHAVRRGAKIDIAAQYAKDLDSIKGSGVKFLEIIRRGATIL